MSPLSVFTQLKCHVISVLYFPFQIVNNSSPYSIILSTHCQIWITARWDCFICWRLSSLPELNCSATCTTWLRWSYSRPITGNRPLIPCPSKTLGYTPSESCYRASIWHTPPLNRSFFPSLSLSLLLPTSLCSCLISTSAINLHYSDSRYTLHLLPPTIVWHLLQKAICCLPRRIGYDLRSIGRGERTGQCGLINKSCSS